MAQVLGTTFSITVNDSGSGSSISTSPLGVAAAALSAGQSATFVSATPLSTSMGHYTAWNNNAHYDPIGKRVLVPSKDITTNPHKVIQLDVLSDVWSVAYSGVPFLTTTNYGHPNDVTTIDRDTGSLYWIGAQSGELRRWNGESSGTWTNYVRTGAWGTAWSWPVASVTHHPNYFGAEQDAFLVFFRNPSWDNLGKLVVLNSEGARMWYADNVCGGQYTVSDTLFYSPWNEYVTMCITGGSTTSTLTGFNSPYNATGVNMPCHLIRGSAEGVPSISATIDAPCPGSNRVGWSGGTGGASTRGYRHVAFGETFLLLETDNPSGGNRAFKYNFPVAQGVGSWSQIPNHGLGTYIQEMHVVAIDELGILMSIQSSGSTSANPGTTTVRIWKPNLTPL